MEKNVLALDIGGTKIFCGRYDENLNLEDFFQLPTEAKLPKEKTLENILACIEKVRNKESLALGISWAGFVDSQKGKILKATNIPHLNNFEICKFIKKETRLKTFLENDARLFALAEQKEKYPESNSFLGIIIGTGVGSGILINQQIFSGTHGFAGEIGHILQNNNDLDVEQIISGPALAQIFKVKSLQEISATLPKNKSDILEKIEKPLETLSLFLFNMILTFDPKSIVIGGGAGIYFWQNFKKEIEDNVNFHLKKYPIKFHLEFSELKNAGAKGAAILAWEKI